MNEWMTLNEIARLTGLPLGKKPTQAFSFRIKEARETGRLVEGVDWRHGKGSSQRLQRYEYKATDTVIKLATEFKDSYKPHKRANGKPVPKTKNVSASWADANTIDMQMMRKLDAISVELERMAQSIGGINASQQSIEFHMGNLLSKVAKLTETPDHPVPSDQPNSDPPQKGVPKGIVVNKASFESAIRSVDGNPTTDFYHKDYTFYCDNGDVIVPAMLRHPDVPPNYKIAVVDIMPTCIVKEVVEEVVSHFADAWNVNSDDLLEKCGGERLEGFVVVVPDDIEYEYAMNQIVDDIVHNQRKSFGFDSFTDSEKIAVYESAWRAVFNVTANAIDRIGGGE